jgi:hypothetical protein
MDFADIQAAVLAARTYTHTLDEAAGISVQLCLPTEDESLIASCDVGLGSTRSGPAAMLLLSRRLLERAVRGWTGLRLAHLVPDHEQAQQPLAWSAEVVPLLLDAQPQWAQALRDELVQRINARRAATQAEAKN